MTQPTDRAEGVTFAWTPGTGAYKHYPPYVNLTGNRLAVRGPEKMVGLHYEQGAYAFVDLPDDVLAELRSALDTRTQASEPSVPAGAIGPCPPPTPEQAAAKPPTTPYPGAVERFAVLVEAVDEFEHHYVPSGIAESPEWQAVRAALKAVEQPNGK